jgi:regulator of nucleoside diphosphate kinase
MRPTKPGSADGQDAQGPRRFGPRLLVSEEDEARLRAVILKNAAGPGSEEAERLAAELDRATIVPQVPPNVVSMRSRVLLEVVETGKRREAVIAYPEEANSSREFVSVLSPIGMALLGLAVGDAIAWSMREGATTILRVISLLQQPQGSGDGQAGAAGGTGR